MYSTRGENQSAWTIAGFMSRLETKMRYFHSTVSVKSILKFVIGKERYSPPMGLQHFPVGDCATAGLQPTSTKTQSSARPQLAQRRVLRSTISSIGRPLSFVDGCLDCYPRLGNSSATATLLLSFAYVPHRELPGGCTADTPSALLLPASDPSGGAPLQAKDSLKAHTR